MGRELSVAVILLVSLACAGASHLGEQQQHLGGGRRLLAVRDGRPAGGSGSRAATLRAGLGPEEAAAARLCAMQCLQHGCISWSKIYMGLGDESGSQEQQQQQQQQQPGEVPAAVGECLAQCGMAAQEAGCLAQTFNRLLNTSPLQFSCSSSCVAGLLHSACSQCGGASGEGGCAALNLGAAVQARECLVDAAV